MKKFIALFLCTVYFIFANAGLAFAGNLYFVKNSNKESIKNQILDIFQDKSYTIKKQDPYYAISPKNSNNYVIIILQPSSNNYFYYFKTNHDNKIDKQILKALKKADVEYEQSFNSQYLQMFESQAQKVYLNTVGQYSFQPSPALQNTIQTQQLQTQYIPSQTQTTQLQTQYLPPQTQMQYQTKQNQSQYQTQQIQDRNALTGSVIQVAKGSKFKSYLQTPLNTSTAAVGDEVRAVLSADWLYGGKVIAPQGSLLVGAVTKARHATYGSLNGKVVFSFNKLMTPDGKTYNINTDNIDFTVTNEGKLSRSVGSVVASAAAGALVGLLIGVCSKDSSVLKTTAISAGIGAGAGAVRATAERGVDAEIPVYTEVEVTLLTPFSIVSGY